MRLHIVLTLFFVGNRYYFERNCKQTQLFVQNILALVKLVSSTQFAGQPKLESYRL